MVTRAAKADLDNRTFLDGAIYLYRRKTSKCGLWDILELRRGNLQNPTSDIYMRNDVPSDGFVFTPSDQNVTRVSQKPQFKLLYYMPFFLPCAKGPPDDHGFPA